LQESIRPKGLLIRDARDEKMKRKIRVTQGAICRTANSSPTSGHEHRSKQGGGPGGRRRRCSGELGLAVRWGIKRGGGELGGGLTVGRDEEGRPQSGRRRSASSPARFPAAAAALRCERCRAAAALGEEAA
jgi:hypothetical protein